MPNCAPGDMVLCSCAKLSLGTTHRHNISQFFFEIIDVLVAASYLSSETGALEMFTASESRQEGQAGAQEEGAQGSFLLRVWWLQ